MELGYEYPYQWSNTGDQDQALVLPAADRRADDARVLPVLLRGAQDSVHCRLRIPRAADDAGAPRRQPPPHRAAAQRRTAFAVEAEQEGYERHPALRSPSSIRQSTLFQKLTHPEVGGASGHNLRRRLQPTRRTVLPDAVAADSAGALTARANLRSRARRDRRRLAGNRDLKALQRRRRQLGGRDGVVPDDPRAIRHRAQRRRAPRSSAARSAAAWSATSRSRARLTAAGGCTPSRQAYVFVTTLAYVALRLLGLAPMTTAHAGARRWLHAQPGGVLGIPSWGKFWLSMPRALRLRGREPVPARAVPAARRGCPSTRISSIATRATSISASAYLYGRRFRGDLGPITEELRRELYAEPYDAHRLRAHRHDVAPTDLLRRARAARCARPATR